MSEKEKILDIPAQVRDETSELRLLFEVSQALEASSELTDQLDAALGLMARYTGMMRGTLALLSPDGQEIEVEASFGLKPHQLERARYKLGEGVTGRVIETGTPVVVPNVSKEPLFLNKTGARDLAKEDISFICVPIKIGGETVGALSADRLFDDSVRLEEDTRLLQVLASLIARAVRVRREFNQKHKAVIEENRRLQTLVQQRFQPGPIIAGSSPMRRIFDELAQVAPSGATVLIRGESGTGKELIAATIHANSPRDALTRLESMVLMSHGNLPLVSIRRQIASAIHLIVQIERMRDGMRRVTSISEITGMEGEIIITQDLFRFAYDTSDFSDKVKGTFDSSHIRPGFIERARYYGLEAALMDVMQS